MSNDASPAMKRFKKNLIVFAVFFASIFLMALQNYAFACEKDLIKPTFLNHEEWINCPLRQKPPKDTQGLTKEEIELWKPPFKQIATKLHIYNLYELNHKTQTFKASGAISFHWDGKIKKWGDAPINAPHASISSNDWTNFESPEYDDNEYYTGTNGIRSKAIYFDGKIGAKFDYKMFPFDNQKLVVEYEAYYDAYHYILTQDKPPTFDAEYNNFLNYAIDEITVKNVLKVYPTIMDVPDYEPWETLTTSIVQNTFFLKKSRIDAFFKFVLPLLVIALLLLINASKYSFDKGVKLSLPPASLLAMIFLQTETNLYLPAVSYLTFLDYLYVYGYLLVFVCFVEALFTYNENFSAEEKHIYLLRRRCLIVTMLFLCFIAPTITFAFIWR